jgi:histone acetyltransferase MYST1
MADGGLIDMENVGEKLENAFIKQERRAENSHSDNKVSGDNEDADSVEEQPLDIGEHYLVRRSDGSWRKYTACRPTSVVMCIIIVDKTFIVM